MINSLPLLTEVGVNLMSDQYKYLRDKIKTFFILEIFKKKK